MPEDPSVSNAEIFIAGLPVVYLAGLLITMLWVAIGPKA
jgi:hypothetical protein